MRLTSIGSSLSDLEQSERGLELAMASYRATVADVALLACHTNCGNDDPAERASADRLAVLVERVDAATPPQLPGCASELRGILHDYGERTTEYVTRLEQDRKGTERALQELAASLEQANDGHDGPIRATIHNLRSISRAPDARMLRDALRSAADTIERGVDQIQRQHQSAVAQLHRELRTMQKEADPTGGATPPEKIGLLDRAALGERILGVRPGETWLAILRIRGLKLAAQHHGPEAVSQVVSAFTARLRGVLPFRTTIGRWGQEEFVTLMPPPASTVSPMSMCKLVLDGLAGPFTFSVEGRSVRPNIEISACVLDTNLRETPAQVMEKVEISLTRI